MIMIDIPMPHNCIVCRFYERSAFLYSSRCCINRREHGYGEGGNFRPDWCPLKKLPKHGKLIDADTLGMTDFEIVMCNGDYKELAKMILEKIENAPTVIPASEEA